MRIPGHRLLRSRTHQLQVTSREKIVIVIGGSLILIDEYYGATDILITHSLATNRSNESLLKTLSNYGSVGSMNYCFFFKKGKREIIVPVKNCSVKNRFGEE